MSADTKRLGKMPIGKLLWTFSFPATIGMIVNAIYNIVDRIFVGQAVGEDALAALSFAFPFMTAIMAVAMLVGLGGTSIFAISLGEGNVNRAKKNLANVFTFAGIFEIIVSILGYIFLKPLLVAFGTPEGIIMDYATAYMRIVLFGSIFQGIGFALNAIIRSDGNPKMAMISMLAGAITNIFFDWLFTMVFPFGVAGVAVATVMGQLATMVWTIYYFTRRSNVRLSFRSFRADFSLMKKIMLIGLSPALVQLAMASVNILYNNSLVYYGGSIAVSAFSVYNSAMTIAIMPIFGINQGVQPIVGYNYGAKSYGRVRKAMKYGVLWATIVSVSGWVIIRLFPELIVRAFNSSPELIKLGVQALRVNSLGLPLVGAQVICSNYFQYINKPKAATFLSLSRQCLFLIPALFITPRLFGLDGIFYAQPISDILAFTVAVILSTIALKKLGKQKTISLDCPAKVNLSLDVTGKRPDGYHNLETIMHTVNICDRLTIKLEESPTLCITMQADSSVLPTNEDNLCIKAANAFMNAAGKTGRIAIDLEKNIPVGAGLGGGSSDAAGTLIGLNKLFGTPLSDQRLCEIAAALGADVPFFIQGGCTLARGIGEILSPLPTLQDTIFVVAKPDYGISTPYVYKNLVLNEETKHPDTKSIVNAVKENNITKLGQHAANVLETVVIKEHKEIEKYKDLMKNYGAIYSLMSGSGSSVFGVFTDMSLAKNCAEELKKHTNQVFIA